MSAARFSLLWLIGLWWGGVIFSSSTISYGQEDAVPTIGALAIWPLGTGEIGAARFGADTTQLIAWPRNSDRILIFSTTEQAITATHMLDARMEGVQWRDDGRMVGWSGATWWLYASWGQMLLLTGEAHAPITALIWGADGAWLLTGHSDGQLIIWDTQEGDRLHTAFWRYPIDRLAMDEGHTRVLLGSWAGTAAVYDLMAQRFVAEYEHDTRALVFGVFGTHAVDSWGWEGSIRWSTGARLDLGVPLWEVARVGALLLGRAADGRVAVVDDVGAALRTWLPHGDRVTTMVAHDDALLLTTSADGLARVWELPSGTERLRLLHTAAVMGGMWSADGQRILTWDAEGALRIFPMLVAGDCFVTAPQNANLRDAPSTTGAFMGTLAANTGRFSIGQTVGADGFVWYQLVGEVWVRADVVSAVGCT